jgi:hypothetical protein
MKNRISTCQPDTKPYKPGNSNFWYLLSLLLGRRAGICREAFVIYGFPYTVFPPEHRREKQEDAAAAFASRHQPVGRSDKTPDQTAGPWSEQGLSNRPDF